jgi:DNA ligase-1
MYTPPMDKKPVMKVKHLHEIPDNKKVWPCIGSIKFDGVYAYQIIRPGDYRIFSRTGMQYTSLKHLEDSARENMSALGHCVLIFEVWHDSYPVNIISGKCRDQGEQHPELHAVLHDVIPYRDFVAGKCQIPYKLRLRSVKQVQAEYYRFAMNFELGNESEANRAFDTFVSEGHEGIIGRNPEGMWIAGHKKNADMWKKKIELSYDLEVVGMLEGKGKYTNTLGVLQCKFKTFGKPDGEDCIVECSGMTDAQRRAWWLPTSTETIIGKIVKVDAMTFSANGLLREPRFKEVREDKLEADI